MPDDGATEQNVNGVDSPSETVTPQSLVTEDHVRAALTADKGAAARLTDWKVVDFTQKGDNYACVVTSVEVKYQVEGRSCEVAYVVKLNPCRNFESMMEFTYDIFEKEASFYLELAPDMNTILREIGEKPLQLPKCFHASSEKGKELIFLEDLRARGFKMTDRQKGLDKAHTILVLQELARLHAASVLVQAKTPDEDIIVRYPFLKRAWTYYLGKEPALRSVFESELKNSRELLVSVGGYDRATAWIDSVLPRMVDMIDEQLMAGKCRLMCHGDCWNNNVLFRYNDEGHPVEVMLLDLQLMFKASPSIDLNYLIYTSTTGEVRRPNLDTFLSTYYNSFTNVLQAANQEVPITREELQQDFREHNTYGAMFSMFLLPFMMMDPEDAIDLSKGTDEDLDDMMKDMNKKSAAMWDNNPVMRPRFLSMFEDMMEAGVIP